MSEEHHITIIPPDPNEHQVYHQTVVVQSEGAILFPIITLAFYFIFFPIGLIMNFIGLFTGPHRGCFLAMIIFLLLPGIILFAFVMSMLGFASFMHSF